MLLALALLAALPLIEDGQGPADPDAVVSGLTAGTHWLGAPFDPKAAVGKVTLVTYWGS